MDLSLEWSDKYYYKPVNGNFLSLLGALQSLDKPQHLEKAKYLDSEKFHTWPAPQTKF